MVGSPAGGHAGIAAMVTGIALLSAIGSAGVRPVGATAATGPGSVPASAPSLSAGSITGAVGAAAPGPAGGSRTRTRWTWPLTPGAPTVVHRFQVGPQRWSAGHRGVDLAAEAGHPVVAAGPGRVAFVGVIAGRGVITVEHAGGLRTTYEPVTASVSRGDAVVAGQPLGTVQVSGSHCAPLTCLHWGLRNATRYLDPLLLLRAPHPVLLPDAQSGVS